MKYFVSIFIGFLMAVGGYAVLFAIAIGTPPTASAKRIGDWFARKESLANAVEGPRILTVCGSSGLYGISSEMLTRETGIPSINMATHAALSLDYLLTKIQGVARRGDVVLMALEYEHFVSNPANAVFSDYVLGCDPGYIRSQPPLEQARWFFSAPTGFLVSGLTRQISGGGDSSFPNFAGELNDFGDILRNSVSDRRPAEAARLNATRYLDAIIYWNNLADPAVWKRITDFARWCEGNGVILVATFPPTLWFPKYEEATVQDALERLVARFDEAGIPLLGRPQDFMLPAGEFFDTQYHLNSDGRIKHTAHLLGWLKPFLNEHAPESMEAAHEN